MSAVIIIYETYVAIYIYIYNEIDDQLSVDEIDRVRIYALIPSTREHEDTPAQLVTSC